MSIRIVESVTWMCIFHFWPFSPMQYILLNKTLSSYIKTKRLTFRSVSIFFVVLLLPQVGRWNVIPPSEQSEIPETETSWVQPFDTDSLFRNQWFSLQSENNTSPDSQGPVIKQPIRSFKEHIKKNNIIEDQVDQESIHSRLSKQKGASLSKKMVQENRSWSPASGDIWPLWNPRNPRKENSVTVVRKETQEEIQDTAWEIREIKQQPSTQVPQMKNKLVETYIHSSYDYSEIKRYWGFKWLEQALITEVLQDKEVTHTLDKTIAHVQLQDLTEKYKHLNDQFSDIQERKDLTDKKRKQVRVALNQTKKTIAELQESIANRLEKIELLEKVITQNKIRLKVLIPNMIEVEKELTSYTKMFYKTHNDMYSSHDDINIIKLFGKHSSIAHTLATDIMIQDLTIHLSSLVADLWWYKDEYSKKFILLHEYTTRVESEIDHVEKEKKLIQQQLENYDQFLHFVENNKEYIDSQKQKLESIQDDRKDQDSFLKSLADMHNSEHIQDVTSSFTWSDTRIDEETFFDFPIPEIKKITSHFEDEWYGHLFHTDHYALDFRLAQWSFVYAPAPWYVLKVVDQNSPLLNWIIIIHQQNLATVYLHMQDIFLDQWMYVNKWDIIGLSGWTPWTKWAGLMTTWPHLHREVRKDGELRDPLMFTDLSPLKKSDLQQKHITKRKKDSSWKSQIFTPEKKRSEVKKELEKLKTTHKSDIK